MSDKGLASNNGTMTGSNPVLATNKHNNINLNIGDKTMKRNVEKTDKTSDINHYITILQSYLAGEELEHRIKESNDNWTPCICPVFDFLHTEYRVKPKQTHRPYKSGEEAFAEIQEHSASGWLYNTITMCYESITCIASNGISTYKENYSYEEAFNTFVYPNETKFGVKLDEEV